MRTTSLRLQNFRSFADSGPIELSQINVLIGANNAGKTTILRGLSQLQHGVPDPYGDVRVGKADAHIEIGIVEGQDAPGWITQGSTEYFTFNAIINSTDRRQGSMNFYIKSNNNNQTGDLRLPATEPHHFVVPFLSKRKTSGYLEDVREENVLSVASDVSHLAAKLSRLGNPAYPFHQAYYQACKSILGFVVTSIPSPGGQSPGVYLPDGQTIPINQLGEGVPNIVHLLASLAVSEQKLFLLEEPENDLHPQALKVLLDLIIESSTRNQFVVSTHSNIVVRQLCAAQNSLLYQVRPKSDALPIESEIVQVPSNPTSRLAVLSDLGYSFTDLELWDGWLFLEESSAERIIRDYLIPLFVPTLSRLRTVSANGASKVGPLFEDLQRLFLFTHLTPVYRERSWVVVDGDDAGIEAIQRLTAKFPQNYHNRFRTFSQSNFEKYYPSHFSVRVAAVMGNTNKHVRLQEKRDLFDDVIAWLDEEPNRCRRSLESSAAEVIGILKEIAGQMEAATQ
jgi:ABC-type transport system involved in cytochrome c biogenesis ATPase subunit